MSKDDPKKKKGYAVGYGKPPVHSRFQPGKSGNPRGRSRGSRNLATDARDVLATLVKLNTGEKVIKMTTQMATMMRLREKALSGNLKAIEMLIRLGVAHNNADPTGGATESTPEDDAFVEAYLKAQIERATSDIILVDPEIDDHEEPGQ